MKRYLAHLRNHLPFLIYVLACDVFFLFLLWVSDASAFAKVAFALLLFTVLAYAFVCFMLYRRENRVSRIFEEYFSDPKNHDRQILLDQFSGKEKERMASVLTLLEENESERNRLQTQNEDYEEYVEAWAHEAKTPIALLGLLLDNRSDEMDPEMVYKIEYIRSRLGGSVDQMLQYARIKGGRKDYYLEFLPLHEIVEEVVEDYRPLLSEKDFTVINEVGDERIYADKRGLLYMIGQFVSNSIKYSSEDPKLVFRVEKPNRFVVEDNGIGVKKSDLPFIFERGFTGNTGQARKKATGMGLYLAEKIAEDMNFKLIVASEMGKGFQIVVQYPDVEEQKALPDKKS